MERAKESEVRIEKNSEEEETYLLEGQPQVLEGAEAGGRSGPGCEGGGRAVVTAVCGEGGRGLLFIIIRGVPCEGERAKERRGQYGEESEEEETYASLMGPW